MNIIIHRNNRVEIKAKLAFIQLLCWIEKKVAVEYIIFICMIS